jgi:hypothetical protein
MRAVTLAGLTVVVCCSEELLEESSGERYIAT